MGYINVGRHGDVKQIDRSAKMLLYPRLEGLQKEHKKVKQIVFFEIGEIGVKIVDFANNEVNIVGLLLCRWIGASDVIKISMIV